MCIKGVHISDYGLQSDTIWDPGTFSGAAEIFKLILIVMADRSAQSAYLWAINQSSYSETVKVVL